MTAANVVAYEGGLGGTALLPTAAIGGTVALVAFADGGYFPASWGWTALALLWIAGLTLLLSTEVVVGRLEWAVVGALVALALWSALSATWAGGAARPVTELQRMLVYIAGCLATYLVARRRDAGPLVGAVLAASGLVATYSLATKLFPDRFGALDPIAGARLSEPLGYWNGLGLLAAMAVLLALGVAARAERPLARAAGAAALPLLVATLYFTFSRGAWAALFAGLLAAVALTPRRLQLVTAALALAPASAAGVAFAASSEGLTRREAAVDVASREGHRLAVVLLLLALGSAAAALALNFLERRLTPSRRVRLTYACVLVLVATGAAGIFVVRAGGPATFSREAYNAFSARPPRAVDLNARLFSLSGSGRAIEWRVAWDEYRKQPWFGSGAGTYERGWLQHRPVARKVRDAHSLYLETLVELGSPGLALLAAALGIPLLGAVKARRHPLVPAAGGAYVAYLAHAGIDWDWELPAVTLTALVCGGSMLVATRPPGQASLSPRAHAAAAAVTLALAGVAFVGLVGNLALDGSARAAAANDVRGAETHARRAVRWAPWSAEALRLLGEAQLAQGRVREARVSFRRAVDRDPGDWELWLALAAAADGRERRWALAEAERLNPLGPAIAELRAELSGSAAAADAASEER